MDLEDEEAGQALSGQRREGESIQAGELQGRKSFASLRLVARQAADSRKPRKRA